MAMVVPSRITTCRTKQLQVEDLKLAILSYCEGMDIPIDVAVTAMAEVLGIISANIEARGLAPSTTFETRMDALLQAVKVHYLKNVVAMNGAKITHPHLFKKG